MIDIVKRHSVPKTIARGFLFIVLALVVSPASAQTSIVDGKTPTGLTPGAPVGSYPLSGIENVNLFNGNLNFHLPLLKIGGRGSAGYTMMLPIEQKWIVKFGQTPPFGQTPMTPNPNWWEGIKPGYGPGVLQGRRTSYETDRVYYEGILTEINLKTLTRLTFTGPDGTEYEFRDQLTNGEPNQCTWYPSQGDGWGFSRGTVFVTADGSAATFISDVAISDYKSPTINLSHRLFYPSGYMMLKDGTRYRIDGGAVSWIRDRNGNKVIFGATIKDSLNRSVTFSQGAGYTEISYSGFPGMAGGARKIRVWYDTLSNRLRPGSGYSIQTYYQLFPLNSASTSTTYNTSRVSKVELPDGRFYEFYYNPYGELARVVLPTGGAYEYDWAGVTDTSEGVIFRYVVERRVYKVAGGTAEHKTQYIRGGSGAGMEVKIFNGNGTVLLGRSLHYFYGDAETSLYEDPAWPGAINFSRWQEGREYKTETFDIVNGTPVLKQRIEHSWQQPLAGSTWPLTSPETSEIVKANNPQITQTLTTLADTNQVAKQTFSYDRHSNRTDTYEYEFGAGAAGGLVRRLHTDYLTTNAVNGYDYACNPATTCGNSASIANVIHLRGLPAQSQVFDAGGAERARTTYEYDKHTDTNHAALLPRLNISGLDAAFTTLYTSRGNVTATTNYILGTPTTSISAYAQYDIAGNVIKTIDGRGYITEADYIDCFGSPDNNARLNSAPLELSSVGEFSFAFATKITNALNHITYSQFDYSTGQPVNGEDANGTIAGGYYNDLLDRPTQIRRAVGTLLESQTTFSYDDANRTVTTTSDLNSFNDPNPLKSQMLYDELGRIIESRQYESATTFITTRKTYDALGRSSQSSNPYRSGETIVWTTTAYDGLGRVLSVTTPDNAVVSTSYIGNTVTVTDQAGKKRKSETDAPGRLKKVYEDPNGLNYLTSYSYDVLDNLLTVTQGTQTRTFVYNSLKRLTSAANPESGTVSYVYDNNDNLTQKTDTLGRITSYVYDALNRNTTVNYHSTVINPDITRTYDGATKGIGRLWASYAGGTETTGTTVEHIKIESYDALGQALDQRQRFKSTSIWSGEYRTQRTYNLAGGVITQTYPSGRTVTYAYDNAGRTRSLTGNLGDGVNRSYATTMTYSPFGGLRTEQFGTTTALYHKLKYNIRGQLYSVALSSVNDDTNWNRGAIVNYYSFQPYGFGTSGPDNNGNLLVQQHWVPNDDAISSSSFMQQNYGYDALNRLDWVGEYQDGTTGPAARVSAMIAGATAQSVQLQALESTTNSSQSIRRIIGWACRRDRAAQ